MKNKKDKLFYLDKSLYAIAGFVVSVSFIIYMACIIAILMGYGEMPLREFLFGWFE